MPTPSIEIDDQVSLKTPFRQNDTDIDVGTEGLVKAVYPAGLIDVQFENISNPMFKDDAIPNDVFTIPYELLKHDTGQDENEKQQLQVADPNKGDPVPHPDTGRQIGDYPIPPPEDDMDANKKKSAREFKVNELLSDFIKTGGQDFDEFLRYASRRSMFTELEIAEILKGVN